jgi:hypothetical protein
MNGVKREALGVKRNPAARLARYASPLTSHASRI